MSLRAADFLAIGLFVVLLLRAWRKRTTHLPPGPPCVPLLGNVLQIPKELPHVGFRDLANVYGDIMTLRVPGYNLVFLTSREAMSDLFVQRSSTYSDRPELVMCRKLVGMDGAVVLSDDGPHLRLCRKLLRKGLGPSATRSFEPFLNRQSAFLLDNLMKRPGAFVDVVKWNSLTVAMKVAYGSESLLHDDKLYDAICLTTQCFGDTVQLGKWIVDAIPILQYLPSWVPLASFQRYAARTKPAVEECINKPFEETKRQLEHGTAGGSFCAMSLQEANGDPETEDCVKWSSTGMLFGQMDTTTAAMSWFFLAMALHPEVQAKAQAEIDLVVGGDRLPCIEDQESLPYVHAIMQETFRWHPVATTAAHASSKDDHYRGYYIPAKTIVIGNIWAILHDEEVYHDAEKFIPERFTEEGAPDSLDVVFGFGRRICPGKLIAQSHMFVSIAATLATFNITKARDANGCVIEPVVEDSPSGINFPMPFEASLKPRSQAAADLIRDSVKRAEALADNLDVFETDA